MTREEFVELISTFDYDNEQRAIVLDWFENCQGKGGKEEVIAEGKAQRIWANAARWNGRVRKEERVMKVLDDGAPEKAFHIFACEIKKITKMQHIDATQGMIDALQIELNKQREKIKDEHIKNLKEQMVYIQQELLKYDVTK